MWNKLSYPFVAAAAVAIAAPTFAEEATNPEIEANVYTKDVSTHRSQGDVRPVEGATATLVTTKDGAWASFDTRELTPGNAYTLWFAAINRPDACEDAPCMAPDVLKRSDEVQSDIGYGDGLITGPDGTGQFVTYRSTGDLPKAWFGNGLQEPQGAEIHLVIQDHGPLIAGMEREMITTYRGGCADDSVPEIVPDTAKADGEPGPNTCKSVQAVIFEQSDSVMAAR